MPFHIIVSDITSLRTDAIVNAANNTLLGGGGVDGAIHRAAGPELLEECRKLGGCETGKAKITGGYNLPAKYIIHTVGPIYTGKDKNEEVLLRNCYRNCLETAKSRELESIAFPLISAGAYGYPSDEAMRVAKEEITGFLKDNDMDVTLCIYNKSDLSPEHRSRPGIDSYITAHFRNTGFSCNMQQACQSYIPAAEFGRASYGNISKASAPRAKKEKKSLIPVSRKSKKPEPVDEPLYEKSAPPVLESACIQFKPELDESFSEMLMRKIDEKGMKDSECYFRANVDRRLFSKIRSSRDYRPSKETAIAFAIALELSMKETEEMLRKAGYALSDSFMFDVIIKFFIENGKYDIFEINETLFTYDQKTI